MRTKLLKLLGAVLLAAAAVGLCTAMTAPEPSICDSYIGDESCRVTPDGSIELMGPPLPVSGYYSVPGSVANDYSSLFGPRTEGFTFAKRSAVFVGSVGAAVAGCFLLTSLKRRDTHSQEGCAS